MRFMILLKSDEATENGAVPDERLINEMGRFNARLEKAGVLRAGEGLAPSREGARVTVTDDRRTVTDGPFAEAKELVAGFWILELDSLAEAVEWARQVPNPHPGGTAELEVRRVVGAEDCGDAFSPEARAAEDRIRERLAKLD
jgi:hypothetical protein